MSKASIEVGECLYEVVLGWGIGSVDPARCEVRAKVYSV